MSGTLKGMPRFPFKNKNKFFLKDNRISSVSVSQNPTDKTYLVFIGKKEIKLGQGRQP